jgi:hypothetical protein
MQPIKPHWAWFFLGPVILVVGCIAAVVVMVAGISSVTEGMQHVDIPGSATIQVDKPGPMPIFYEERGTMEAVAPLALEVRITPVAGTESVPIDAAFTKVTYNLNGVSGRKWGEANFPSAGAYTVETKVPLGTTAGQLAIGGNAGEKIAGSLIGFFGLGFGSFVVCVICMIVVLVKRMGYRKRMMQQQYGAIPQGGMSPPPGASY